MKFIRNGLRRLMLLYKRILFLVARMFLRPDSRTIVFESFQGRSFACNPKGIFDAMISDSRYRDYRFIWVFRDVEKGRKLIPDSRVQLVRFESFAYYKALAKAKYWIFNSM